MRKRIGATALLAAISLLAGQALANNDEATDHASEQVSFGLTVFADTGYIQNESDGVNVAPTGYGFDLKRARFAFNADFSRNWSGRFRSEFNYQSYSGDSDFYVRSLFVQYAFGHDIRLRIGAANLPWLTYVEGLYSYRYVEKTLVDRIDFGSSADWGLHLVGGGERIGWQVSLVSGAGVKDPFPGNGMDLVARIDFQPIAELHFGLGAREGHLGQDNAVHTATRYDALVAWIADDWRLGLEYFHANNYQNVTTSWTDSADGWSLFGAWTITPRIALFARYDHVRPCQDTTPACTSTLHNDYYNFGLQFSATEKLQFAVVYKYSRVANGFLDTANGLIGGVNSGTYREIGVFMQLQL